MSPLGSPTEPNPFPPTAVAPARPLFVPDQPTPCVKCGYDLRTLSATGVCPECATPIQTSLVSIEPMSPRDWTMLESGLRTVRFVNCIEVAPAFALVGVLEFPGPASPWLVCLLALLIACAAILRARGYTLIAKSIPRAVGNGYRERSRWRLAFFPHLQVWLRLAAVLFVVSFYLVNFPLELPLGILAIGICGSGIIQYIAFMDVLGTIGDAGPAACVHEVRRFFSIAIPVSFTVLLLFYGFGIFACWLLYLLMLSQLISEARRRVARSSAPAPV